MTDNKTQTEIEETQELVNLTLEEAEEKAKAIIENANKEAEGIITIAEESAIVIISDSEVTSKAVRKAKYIALTNIKEDGKLFKIGEPYLGKRFKQMLESKSIRLNKK